MKGHFLIPVFLLLHNLECFAQNDFQFPIGSAELLSFPRKWPASNDSVKFTSQLNEVKSFYEKLSRNKNAVLPFFPILAQFEVGDKKGDSLFCFCSDSLKNDSCYKLPNMGLFECYFVSSSLYENQLCSEHFPENKYSKFGNLIMFNRQKQEGECYTVYYETKGKNNSYRFFRVPNEKKIEIYECNFNNGTYILYDRWTISVFLKKGRTSFRENP